MKRSWLRATLVVLAACSDPSDPPNENPPNESGIRFVSGSGQADTVGAVLPKPIVVQLWQNDAPLAGANVQFFSNGAIFLTESDTSPLVNVTTDVSGRAQVRVKLACVAGDVQITADRGNGYYNTTTVTGRRGQTVRTDLVPGDTAVRIGGTLQLRALSYDRCGNGTDVSGSFSTASPDLQVTSVGRVTGLSFGRAQVVGRGSTWTDTAYISVVPDGSIDVLLLTTMRMPSPLVDPVTINLDGSQMRLIPGNPFYDLSGGSVARSRDKMQAAISLGPAYGARTVLTSSGGTSRPLLADSTADGARIPTFSPDGNWLYYTARGRVFGAYALWRVRTNGTDLTELTSAGEYGAPSFSPDGNRVVFISSEGRVTDGPVSIFNVQTGSVTQLTLRARTARWSPNGDQLALISNNAVVIATPDGSQSRLISSPANFYRSSANDTPIGLSWSPDSKYVIAQAGLPTIGYPIWLDIIDVATGETVPLAYMRKYIPSSPVWTR